MLQMTPLMIKLKIRSEKPLTGKKRQTKLATEEVKILCNLRSILERKQQNDPKPENKNQKKLVVKQKVRKNRLIVFPKHQKWLQVLAAD